MLGVELGVAHAACELLRSRDGFLRFQCELVEVHVLFTKGQALRVWPALEFRVGMSSIGGCQGTRSRRYCLCTSLIAARICCSIRSRRRRAFTSSSCRRSTFSTPARFRPS